MSRYLLGFDLGSSSVKAALVEVASGRMTGAAQSPAAEEMPIDAPQPGWAEQDPERWWREAVAAAAALREKTGYQPGEVGAVGIAYQMHGLVCLDKGGQVLRPSIIWCDSRAVETGRAGSNALGEAWCREHLLNQPGNFTAAKLAWLREHEPDLHARVRRILLPGEWLAHRMGAGAVTTPGGLSEGMFWDFAAGQPSAEVLSWAGVDVGTIGDVRPAFGPQGEIDAQAAADLGVNPGTPICYRAGDQPNNAWSLGVIEPGEAAATCGTSGVVYAVGDQPPADPAERWNVFAHVNHQADAPRYGALLCLNGAGITYGWVRRLLGAGGSLDYEQLNGLAEGAKPGCEGLVFLPFGNGAERMLGNEAPGGSLTGIDFLRQGPSELARAAVEGVAFALAHGLVAMREAGIPLATVRAGRANLFLSPLFRRTLAAAADVAITLAETDGAGGAARGAGLGCGLFTGPAQAMAGLAMEDDTPPDASEAAAISEAFARWRETLAAAVTSD